MLSGFSWEKLCSSSDALPKVILKRGKLDNSWLHMWRNQWETHTLDVSLPRMHTAGYSDNHSDVNDLICVSTADGQVVTATSVSKCV